MDMEMEFHKDLHHNYMVLKKKDESVKDEHGLKVLFYQSIEGILSMNKRNINNQVKLYYDITGKQSLSNLADKWLTLELIKKLIVGIIEIVEKAYEYLIPEDNFILLPEYIYLDVVKESPSLCYYPGYGVSIREQIITLIEHLMNKVNYNDKEAVLFVYNLYSICREEGFTIKQLSEAINEKKMMPKKFEHSTQACKDKRELGKTVFKEDVNLREVEKEHEEEESIVKIPAMMEKMTDEKELLCYPLKTYCLTGISILGGIILLAISFFTGIVYNPYGNRIDYSKLFAIIILLICMEGYLLKLFWDKKNRITKMVSEVSYFDPRKFMKTLFYNESKGEGDHQKAIKSESKGEGDHQKEIKSESKGEGYINHYQMSSQEDDMEEINATCLLNEIEESNNLLLEPVDKLKYEPIMLTDFPFFIGKLKRNVDYCIEKDVVSRYHAKITKEKGKYYITDLNSRNGTFVNSDPVPTYQKKELSLGDVITFANIKYKFVKA